MNDTENIKVETDPVTVINIYFKRYKAIEKWGKMLNGYKQESQGTDKAYQSGLFPNLPT